MDPSLIDAGAAVAHDLSLWGLFMKADIVVKAVMLLLIVMSVWVWAIVFDKALRLRRLQAAAAEFEDDFWSGGSLDTLYDRVGPEPEDPMQATFAAGMREWRHAAERGIASRGPGSDLQSRVERGMNVAIGRKMAEVEKGMNVLATTGSAAPFIGLFGTVWGIMNAFIAIAGTRSTSLAVVAPGIAEALFATALGLLAAIPAVMAYNKFSNDMAKYADRLEAFAEEFASILSRHLEEQRAA
jgi:biopolymer transport protein TolQ